MAVDAMQRQVDARGLSGTSVPQERLHVTLHWLGDHDDVVPQKLLRGAEDAARNVDMAPFGVGFDRMGSLGGAGMGGLALTGSAELKTLRLFQRTLGAAMRSTAASDYVRTRFNPHVSLLYCERHVPPEPIAPIRWTVDELVLIDSWIGYGKHVALGRWRLQSRQTSFSDW